MHLGEPDFRGPIVRGNPVGTCQSGLESGAETGPVYRCDDGLAQIFDSVDESLSASHELIGFVTRFEPHEFINVCSGNERPFLAGYEDHRSDIIVDLEVGEECVEFFTHFAGNLVDRFSREIQLSPCDSVVDGDRKRSHRSVSLENHCEAHTTLRTNRDQPQLYISALHFVRERQRDSGSGCAKRMTDR